ncbi:MAG: DUF4412 domain-containing protein [Bacteroidota bacterium]
MKKTLFALSFVLGIVLFSSNTLMSGKPFEGVITYKISYPENKISESQMAMFPKVFTVSVKGNNSRTDLQLNGGNQVQILNYTEKTIVTLINMMGQKYAIKQTSAEIEKDIAKEPKPVVELSGETKVIAGYTCKKAVITVNDDGVKSTYEAYFTDELGSALSNFDSPIYKNIEGALMEFSVKSHDINMKFSASSVEKRSLSPKDFEIPSDYTLTTQEELKSKFGGGNE